MINPIAEELPDLTCVPSKALRNPHSTADETENMFCYRIVFGLKDEPQVLLDWESKEALLEASYQKTRESVSLPSPSTLPPLCSGLT